ncbi:MAG TPA: DegT/DnrJ/EryC1/StrS family aminotransferase [Anaerolineales bacterium]|nr:DegT/DnrJ/EryC1/StrS family aminotransferase [Anaerolineales bacterium]
MQEIPLIDLAAQYRSIGTEIGAAVEGVLARGNFILGEETSAFEEEFSAYCGVAHGVGAASGTDAIFLALRACGIGAGDEVITSAHTAVATVAAIELAGARPVLADVDPRTFTLDPRQIGDKVTARTRAVIPVHLYGCPADLTPILEIADRRGLVVIEDCAQAHGAAYRGRKVGGWGRTAAFSFYPTKNLGAGGDAGMLLTDDAALAEKTRLLCQYGWRQRYISEIKGVNSRLDEIQSAILRVKLKYLDRWNQRRRAIAARYRALLAENGLGLPIVPETARHVFHQFVIRSRQRDELRRYLAERRVHTAIHYPVPIHLQPAFSGLGCRAGDFPIAEELAGQILSLPIYPELTDEAVERVCELIREFQRKGAFKE